MLSRNLKILPGKQQEVFAALEDEKMRLKIIVIITDVTTYNKDCITFWGVYDLDSYDDYGEYLE